METQIRAPDQQVLILLECQCKVLERIASGAPLAEVLLTLAKLVEQFAPDLRCAILQADSECRRLRFVAAPNIPDDFKLCMEPFLDVGENVGTCGRAAFLSEPVYTEDTAIDPRWAPCRNVAMRNGLRAVWSTPILGHNDSVLGTVAVFRRRPGLPSAQHIQLIDMATQMARVAIEAERDGATLGTLFDGAPEGILVTDLDGNIARANSAFGKMLGYSRLELYRRTISDLTEGEDHPGLIRGLFSADPYGIASDRRYRSKSGAILRSREHSALWRDATGQPRYVLSQVATMIDAQNDPLGRLTRREREVLELVIAGHSSKEIAGRLHIAAASVDTYRGRIAVKLGIHDLPALVRFAIRQGIASV